jgi:heat-inducible transcriptional repressor
MSHPVLPGGVSRSDVELTPRQREVFSGLLATHRLTARPVGSEGLAARGVRGSTASIRHVLAELESLGLLVRSHAAGARVPSDAGYAWYVRHEVTPRPLGDDELRAIDERLRRSARDVEQLLREASRLLSTLALQLGLAASAPLEHERLARIEVAPLDPARCLLVLELSGGSVRTLRLELESPLDAGAQADVTRTLRERLLGLELAAVRERLASDPALVRDTAVRIVARAAAASWGAPSATTMFSAGMGWIAAQPEFASAPQLAPLLRLVENGPPLDRLLATPVAGQAAVRVALDEDAALEGLSLVAFPVPGGVPVALGVLGPVRMDYARAIAVVDAVGMRVASYL